MIQAIADIAKPLGIAVHDHIIVGKDGHASLKRMKLI
jgi:DNA repair protein RadC